MRRLNKRRPNKKELPTTLIVDGDSLFKTSFYGAKSSYTRDGVHVGGILQSLTMIRKLIKENIVDKVYVFWDGPSSGKLRWVLYPEYKANRRKMKGIEPEDESMVWQRLRLQDYLESLHIRQLQHEYIEADDYIAKYCELKKDEEKIIIYTNDRDITQVIDDNIKIYMKDFKDYVDKTNFMSYFGFPVGNVKLLKILCGDTSDNIKGVERLGEKTLLKHFPLLKEEVMTVENIVEKTTILQEERLNNKKKPLKVFEGIINGVNKGDKALSLFERNDLIIDLKNPLIDEDGFEEFNLLIDAPIDPEDRGIKDVYIKLREDGIVDLLGEGQDLDREINFLLPFKSLIEKEKKYFKNKINE